MNKQIEDQRSQNAFYPQSNKMRYLYIFLALIGLFTVLWFFLFKEEAFGKKIIDEGFNRIGDMRKAVTNVLSNTSITSPTIV